MTQLLRTLSQVKVGLIEAGGVVIAATTTVLMIVVVPMSPMMSLALTSGNVQSNEYRVCPVTWRGQLRGCYSKWSLFNDDLEIKYLPSKSFSVYCRVLPGSFGASSSFGSMAEQETALSDN